MGPEAKVETHLRRKVKALGGYAIKIPAIVAGWPDRLVVLPGGRFALVELKSATGRLRPAQVVIHERLARIGHAVVILRSKEEVDSWLSTMF